MTSIKIKSHWFDLTRVQTLESRIPLFPRKMWDGWTSDSAIRFDLYTTDFRGAADLQPSVCHRDGNPTKNKNNILYGWVVSNRHLATLYALFSSSTIARRNTADLNRMLSHAQWIRFILWEMCCVHQEVWYVNLCICMPLYFCVWRCIYSVHNN